MTAVTPRAAGVVAGAGDVEGSWSFIVGGTAEGVLE